ncbi:ABC transporter permease, partial [Thermodesulfatator indicus]
MSQFISLTPFDIALASGFILLASGLSLYLRLGVEKKLFIAAFRTIVQLSLVGFVLEAIFSLKSPILVISLLFFMALVAGREAAARSRKRYAYMFFDTTLSMSLSAFIVGVIVTQIILGVKP